MVEMDDAFDDTGKFYTYNIHVTDQGKGIDLKDQKTLFKAKTTGKDKGNGMADSHGLGLSICKSIA